MKLEEQLPDLIEAVPAVFLTVMDQVPESKAVGFIRKQIDDITQFLKDTRCYIDAEVIDSFYEH